MKIGTIWLAKLIGRLTSICSRLHGDLDATCRRAVAVIVRRAVGQRHDAAGGGDAHDLGIGDGVLHVAGEIGRFAVDRMAGHQQLGRRIAADQAQFSGLNRERFDVGRGGGEAIRQA